MSLIKAKVNEQVRQGTYNAALKRVHVTIFDMEKNWVLHISSLSVYSLTYAALNANATNCNMWPYRTHAIFSKFSHKLLNFRQNVT